MLFISTLRERATNTMQVITTHLNADFDGLASMIAAQKLYPKAVMAFSGAQERNVREFTSQSLLYSYDFHKIKDIDLHAVDVDGRAPHPDATLEATGPRTGAGPDGSSRGRKPSGTSTT